MKKYVLVPLMGIVLAGFQCSKDSGDDSQPAIPDVEGYFDAAYVASTGFEDFAKTKSISDGNPARVFKDLVGDKDLVWSKSTGVNGADVPSPLWTAPPTYVKDAMGGSVLVQNVSPNLWLSPSFAAVPQPYDVYVVLREHQGVRYEGYFQVGYGLRDRGDRLEFKMNETVGGNYTAVNMDAPTVMEPYKVSIVRLRVDGAKSKVWINNVQLPPGEVNIGSGQLTQLGYGTPSHADQHEFYGMWVKFGTLSEDDHKKVYDLLAAQYVPGTTPEYPIATKIGMTWNNGVWTASYTYFSPTGVAEDKTKTEYKWGFHSFNKSNENGDLNNTSFLAGDNAKKATLTRSDFSAQLPAPHDGSQTEIFVSVKVYDINGKSWTHFLRSEFLADNKN